MKYGELTHFSHPQHKLKFEYRESPFKCDGCKEAGIGSRYTCAMCDFDLHKCCALPPLSIAHPFYTKCSFQFMEGAAGGVARFCNACEKDVNGFVYHCRSCGFDLHPCCVSLPRALDDGETTLFLYRKVGAACHRCGRKGRSWSYRSRCKKYNLHVSCVKEMLLDSWQELYFGKNVGGEKRRMVETRIPSLKGTLENHHRRKGRVRKCCEMAGMAVQIIISAVLGDPTAIIAGVISSFIPR